MSILTKIERIERIHDLIKRKSTGTPETFARKLNVSESTLYHLISELKELGAPIQYCRSRESYEYGYYVNMNFGFTPVVYLNDRRHLRNIKAGTMINGCNDLALEKRLKMTLLSLYRNSKLAV